MRSFVACPKDAKLGTYARILAWARDRRASRFLLAAGVRALFALAPSVPQRLVESARERPGWKGFAWGYGLTFVLCFVTILVWSLVDGSSRGTMPNRLYFLDDVPDLLNYTIICPAYVGLSVRLFTLVVHSWGHMADPKDLILSEPLRLPSTSPGIGIFLVLFVAAVGTVNYIRECLDPSIYRAAGWWIGHVGPDGSRVLSPLGIYYTIANFVLLAICVLSILAFMTLFSLCLRFGRILRMQPESNTVAFETISNNLSDFTDAYITLKLLAVVLVLNIYTWNYRRPQGSMNFAATNAVLVLFGVFLISVPRYYMELEWFWFRTRRAADIGVPDSGESDDLRSYQGRMVAWVADSTILSSFFYSVLHLPSFL